MSSPLDIANTKSFRDLLISKNLKPYNGLNNGVYYAYGTVINYKGNVDAPDLKTQESVANKSLFNLNQYGSDGGYKPVSDPGILRNVKSNVGEYSISKANALKINREYLKGDLSENYYTTIDDLTDSAINLGVNKYWFDPKLPKKGILNYWGNGEQSFTPSSYKLVDLVSNNSNTNVDLEKDSYITRLAKKELNSYFEERVGRTIDKFNLIEKFEKSVANIDDYSDFYYFITNSDPIIQQNWSITKPNNLLVGAAQSLLNVIGGEFPFPTIIGSYFDDTIKLSSTINFGGSIKKKSGSQLFFDNMGIAQRSSLFKNIKSNLYRASYQRSGLVGKFLDLFTKDNSNYYINEDSLDAIETAKEYENNDFKFGLNGDDSSIEGGFTWVSPKYKGNADVKTGKGGENFGEFGLKQTTFDSTQSTNYKFKEGSILDDTQRIINSQPNDSTRLRHPGNAIDQISKVFNDGYKEITKGSKVRAYTYQNKEKLVGGSFSEYCRLFTKDSPYMTYNRLQKTDGIVTEGRRMKGSVLNKTYDLSITPREGNDAKKYMLSIENLAWRTTDKFLDLPECEKGPNQGRIMWFPPYDLKVTDTTSTNWNSNDFLGRPEPVYTYKNTSRSGTLDFSIVVDHPSILNVITNKVLDNESDTKVVNEMLASFFAGCLKYDIYDLAKIYNTITLSELEELQTFVRENQTIVDEISYITKTVITNNDPTTIADVNVPPIEEDTSFNEFNDFALYFDNDLPKNSDTSYDNDLYVPYIVSLNYNASILRSFMDNYVIDNYYKIDAFIKKCNDFLNGNENNKIEIVLESNASSPANIDYNLKLSEKRSKNIENFFKSKIKSNNFTIKQIINRGETGSVTAKSTKLSPITVPDCSKTNPPIYGVQAMACRRVAITKIKATKNGVAPKIDPKTQTTEQVKVLEKVTKTEKSTETVVNINKKNISKKVLQKLLNECDYFKTIEENEPFLFNNLKEKLKYFSPAFHSTTPEGLNGRLTFLQQCTRPGDTIPTIRRDGASQVADAYNTSFGVPPVLVLRVGDFYHTKIIPNNLSITYDPLVWDMNPEGIGFQPMIAKVSLSFNYVGASGLSGAIDKLQNALTFNYFANTEVYDARADITDNSLSDMDEKIAEFIIAKEKGLILPVEDVPTNTAYQTIGEIIITPGTTVEMLSYVKLANSLISEGEKYINSIGNTIIEYSSKYNVELMYYVLQNLIYSNGETFIETDGSNFGLLGVPTKFEKLLDAYKDVIINNINDDDDPFISKIKDEFKKQKSVVFEVKENYKKYVEDEYNKILVDLNQFVNEITKAQEEFQKTLAKALFVASNHGGYDGYDGYIGKDNAYNIYGLSSPVRGIKDYIFQLRNVIRDNYLNKLDAYFVEIEKKPSLNNKHKPIYLLLSNFFRNTEQRSRFFDNVKLKEKKDNTNIPLNNQIEVILQAYCDEEIELFKTNERLPAQKSFRQYMPKYQEEAIKNIKTITTIYPFDVLFDVIDQPDNLTKSALSNLGNDKNYDGDNNTWSKNVDDFFFVKNALIR
jgi:hypothetical protein